MKRRRPEGHRHRQTLLCARAKGIQNRTRPARDLLVRTPARKEQEVDWSTHLIHSDSVIGVQSLPRRFSARRRPDDGFVANKKGISLLIPAARKSRSTNTNKVRRAAASDGRIASHQRAARAMNRTPRLPSQLSSLPTRRNTIAMAFERSRGADCGLPKRILSHPPSPRPIPRPNLIFEDTNGRFQLPTDRLYRSFESCQRLGGRLPAGSGVRGQPIFSLA